MSDLEQLETLSNYMFMRGNQNDAYMLIRVKEQLSEATTRIKELEAELETLKPTGYDLHAAKQSEAAAIRKARDGLDDWLANNTEITYMRRNSITEWLESYAASKEK